MFRALVAILRDDNEPLRSAASVILAATFTPVPTEGGRMSRSPEGGWDQWLDEITAKAAGVLKEYDVCSSLADDASGQPSAEQLFCRGREFLKTDVSAGFKYTLQAAEQGYVPAQVIVGMLYANGKGTQQDYAEAGKWWVKAAEAGHVEAASHAAMLYQSGMARGRDVAQKWSQYVEQHAPHLPH
jgi:TPR repeat protein